MIIGSMGIWLGPIDPTSGSQVWTRKSSNRAKMDVTLGQRHTAPSSSPRRQREKGQRALEEGSGTNTSHVVFSHYCWHRPRPRLPPPRTWTCHAKSLCFSLSLSFLFLFFSSVSFPLFTFSVLVILPAIHSLQYPLEWQLNLFFSRSLTLWFSQGCQGVQRVSQTVEFTLSHAAACRISWRRPADCGQMVIYTKSPPEHDWLAREAPIPPPPGYLKQRWVVGDVTHTCWYLGNRRICLPRNTQWNKELWKNNRVSYHIKDSSILQFSNCSPATLNGAWKSLLAGCFLSPVPNAWIAIIQFELLCVFFLLV